MDDYYARQTRGMLAWGSFARSAGVLVAAFVLLATSDPYTALIWGLSAWFVFFLIRQALPDIMNRNLWSYCSIVIVPATIWIIRWPVAAIALIISLFRGAPLMESVLVLGGLLSYDIAITLLFDRSRDNAPKIARWGLLDGFRLARTTGKYLQDRTNYTNEEFFGAAERALVEYPNEWVIYYTLGDKYQQVGRYVDSLQAWKKCVELRPNDIRSVYALATIYNILTRAAWKTPEEMKALEQMRQIPGNTFGILSPTMSQAALDKTGMDVDTAASQAIRWFEKTLDMKPDSQSRAQITWDLETLYKRFPHLQR